jgi:hypothetical protein
MLNSVVFIGYCLTDTKAAIIVDAEATPARWTAEVGAARTMIERTMDRFGLCHRTRATSCTANPADHAAPRGEPVLTLKALCDRPDETAPRQGFW